MREILELRREKAALLGFESYAHYSLERKMARAPEEVLAFLRDLAARTRQVAEGELAELCAFAAADLDAEPLQAWDLHYYAEKLRRQRYRISQEDLRPYFPVGRVIRGMFDVAERLFGIRVRQSTEAALWHRDVSFYEITDADGARVGELYLDPFARPDKRGGAWMDVCRTRMHFDATLQTPVAYLSCNFTPAVGDREALITHDEVTTLFHEFGHGLHHMLTRVDLPSVAGIAGVEWDAVELPSQFLENWTVEPQAIALFSAHCESGDPLPEKLLSRVRAARNFHSGLAMLRQVEYALFDFRLHLEYAPGTDPLGVLESVRDEVAVLRPPEFNCFAHGFTHIFAGGYAAGYYSYKWAEVLSSDAFSRFEESDVFDADAGAAFKYEILERGGTRDAIDSFVAFRGREPSIAALLRHSGIEPPPTVDAA
jgi:oligopeptidase A